MLGVTILLEWHLQVNSQSQLCWSTRTTHDLTTLTTLTLVTGQDQLTQEASAEAGAVVTPGWLCCCCWMSRAVWSNIQIYPWINRVKNKLKKWLGMNDDGARHWKMFLFNYFQKCLCKHHKPISIINSEWISEFPFNKQCKYIWEVSTDDDYQPSQLTQFSGVYSDLEN